MDYICRKCNKLDETGMCFADYGWFCDQHYNQLIALIDKFIQPERSKREDLHECICRICESYDTKGHHHAFCPMYHTPIQEICKMRCSELHGNMEREAQ